MYIKIIRYISVKNVYVYLRSHILGARHSGSIMQGDLWLILEHEGWWEPVNLRWQRIVCVVLEVLRERHRRSQRAFRQLISRVPSTTLLSDGHVRRC